MVIKALQALSEAAVVDPHLPNFLTGGKCLPSSLNGMPAHDLPSSAAPSSNVQVSKSPAQMPMQAASF